MTKPVSDLSAQPTPPSGRPIQSAQPSPAGADGVVVKDVSPEVRKAGPPSPPRDGRRILIGLMVPMGMTILNLSMFGVALPTIRDTFAAEPDLVAWLVTAYTLPFVVFMPFYGRMGDGLGKRRLFLIGIVVFFVGTVISLRAVTLGTLMVGRFIQGMGTAGVNPLCISIISDLFPAKDRGRALGTWSSTGPAIAMVGPFLGGFLIEGWGWQTIFVPGLIAAPIALYVVRGQLPALRSFSQPDFVRKFDWIGMVLLGGAVTFFVAYLSSRAITGVEPLRDWRLLLGAIVLGGVFAFWERRHANPLATLDIYRLGSFGRASYVAAVRMFTMSGVSFLVPLYLADIYGLNASAMGLMITLHAGALLTTVRLGGQLGDRWSRRGTLLVGLSIQVGVMFYFVLLPAGLPVWFAAVGLVVHGMGAGLSLAVLHQVAMDHVPQAQTGEAAGLYSMTRFGGNILGTTLGGVVLQQALERGALPLASYQITFAFIAGVGLTGMWVAMRIHE